MGIYVVHESFKVFEDDASLLHRDSILIIKQISTFIKSQAKAWSNLSKSYPYFGSISSGTLSISFPVPSHNK